MGKRLRIKTRLTRRTSLNTYRMQHECIIGFDQVFKVILFQTDEPFQVGTVPARAVQTMDHVLLLLLFDEEHVEDFVLALTAIVRGFVLAPAMEADLDSFGAHKLSYQLGVT